MGKFLKKFASHSDYTAAESGLILPNVSLCVQQNEVHYNPYVDPYGGHDYVEIGGKKWATMNVGANSITDGGLYFQWGDTQGYTASQVGSGEGQKAFSWNDYKYTEDGGQSFTKYNATDEKVVLDASDDAATAAWGGNWRMPTSAEFQALGQAVNTSWTNDYQGSGVAGLVLTDKTDSSKVLFFPAIGNCHDGFTYSVSNAGVYWSSSQYDSSELSKARLLVFNYNSTNWNYNYNRYYGNSIRPVAD